MGEDLIKKVIVSSCLAFFTTIVVHIILNLTGPIHSKWLVIGVLSGQNHSRQRDAIRNTWGITVKELGVDLKFIVGSAFCTTHPVDRGTPYSCDRWWPRTTDGDGRIVSNLLEDSVISDRTTGFIGYTFIVKQNFTLREFHVSSCLLTPHNKFARVKLVNSFTGDIVASSTFGFIEDASKGSLIFKKPISPVTLYTSFEGEIIVTSASYNFSCLLPLAKPSVVYIFEGLDADDQYVEVAAIKNNLAVFAGFGFQITEPEHWRDFSLKAALRDQQWMNELAKLDQDLRVERDVHDDFLSVDIVDVYSTLSSKTLTFLKWASSEGYIYLLKTDDDVVVDVRKVIEELHGTDWDWWSCFKIGWPAPNSGKWRDRISKPRIYPEFPSGSGYVLRTDSLKKVLLRSPSLHVGEDVFVGMLASGANFKQFVNSRCHWSCSGMRSAQSCNVPEVPPDQMKQIWDSLSNRSKSSSDLKGAKYD